MNYKSKIYALSGWTFGILFSSIAVLNMFWGNDPEFGFFLFLLSLVYYPPLNIIISRLTGYSIPIVVKIVLGIFIFWASLGVGEFFEKIHLMIKSF